jgi:biotin carboxylase
VRPIDGVMCIASDVPLTVAGVAEALGLPGIPVEAARLAMDKLTMKQKLAAEDVPVPWFSPVDSADSLRHFVSERGYPLVLKPVDSRGARGVLRLTPDVDLEWAYGASLSHSPTGRVMVEQFLDGPQISTESLLCNGEACTPGFSDRNYEHLERFSPYIVENGGQQPSALSHQEREAVARLAERAAKALGIDSGAAKGDMVLTNAGPVVIEIAARLSGGWFCTDQIPLATDVDLVGAAIRLALGEEVKAEELAPRCRRGVAIRYFFPAPGRVRAVKNVETFENISWVHRLGLFVGPGDLVEPVTDHTKRAGFVITVGESREEAVERAERVVESVTIETVPT